MEFSFFFLFISQFTFAQGNLDHRGQPEFRQEGQLVSVRIVKGEPVRIFVVGREEAKLDMSSLKLTVRRIHPYPGKVLSINRKNDYFVISEPIDFQKTTDLEVTTKVKDKSETLQFKLE
jgi:hypothetical protein